MRRAFLEDVSFLVGNAVVSLVFGLGFWVLLLKVRNAPASDVGTAVGFISLAYFVAVWTLLGINFAGQRVVAADASRLRSVMRLGLVAATLGVIVVVGAAVIFGDAVVPLHPGARLALAIALLGLLVAGAAIDLLLGDVLVGLRRTKIFFWKNLAKALARLLLVFVVPTTWESLLVIFLGTEIAANAIAASYVVLRSTREPTARPLLHDLWSMRLPTLVGLLSAGAGLIPVRVIPYFVSRASAELAAGYFIGILALETAKMVPVAIGTMVVPYAAAKQGTINAFAMKTSLAVAIPSALAVALLVRPALAIIAPAYPAEAGWFAVVAAPTIVLYAVSAPLINRIWGEGGFLMVALYSLIQSIAFVIGVSFVGVRALVPLGIVLDIVGLLMVVVAFVFARRVATEARVEPQGAGAP